VDWNNDGLHDLLVGDAGGNVHVFLNTTDNINPLLDGGSTVLAAGEPITVGIRATPIANDWDEDGRKDLLVGNYEGNIMIFINEGTDSEPIFNSSFKLQVGGINFDIGTRAAPRVFDWNEDGLKDLLVGEVEGYVYFLENTGTNEAPLFKEAKKIILANYEPLRYIPGEAPRSRLYITDWNNDSENDILVGGSDGRVMLFLTKS
jgi:hypothetical protein